MDPLRQLFQPAMDRLEARADAARRMLRDIEESDYESPNWPQPIPRESFNDDDWYVFNEASGRLIEQIGCKSFAAEVARRGEYRIPVGCKILRGMSAKYSKPAIWRAVE